MTAPARSHDRIERRIQVLEDIEAIKQLKYRYWRACDTKDPEAFRACFVEDVADIDFERMGRFDNADGIVDVFARIALARRDGHHLILDMHHGMHPDIEVQSPTEAVGRWTLRFRQLDLVNRVENVAAIEYDDGYVVEDGQWRMRKSHARTLWSLSRPLGDDAEVTEGELGDNDPDAANA